MIYRPSQDSSFSISSAVNHDYMSSAGFRLLVLLKTLRSKHCGPISDRSFRSSLIWVHIVCPQPKLVLDVTNYMQQTNLADDIFRCIFHNRRNANIRTPGRVAQSVTCLATDASLIADPGVASSIPARSHTFVEIDHELFSTAPN